MSTNVSYAGMKFLTQFNISLSERNFRPQLFFNDYNNNADVAKEITAFGSCGDLNPRSSTSGMK
jgi:hypothetical protein